MELQRQAVRELLAEHLGRDGEEVRDDSRLVEDLGADSLDIVELAMEAEDRFAIEIRDGEEQKLQLVSDWYEVVERKTAAR